MTQACHQSSPGLAGIEQNYVIVHSENMKSTIRRLAQLSLLLQTILDILAVRSHHWFDMLSWAFGILDTPTPHVHTFPKLVWSG